MSHPAIALEWAGPGLGHPPVTSGPDHSLAAPKNMS
jgi:hypothetical protein